MPADDVAAVARQRVDQVAAGKSGGTRDENGAGQRRGAQRGNPVRPVPPIAPLSGETVPSPASVIETKNVLLLVWP